MSQQQAPDRQLPITQIDELWAIAEKRWGSAGRRTPPPDPRFRDLREHLGKVESLFAKDKDHQPERSSGMKVKRKMVRDDDFDMDEPDEIPF